MAAREPAPPTDAELAILQVLWDRGQATVREVFEGLKGTGSEGRPIGYTTVLKQLQVMFAKGLVIRDEAEKTHQYRAAQPRARTRQRLARRLLDRVFDGSAAELMLGVLAAKKVSPEELAEVRRLLDEHERSRS